MVRISILNMHAHDDKSHLLDLTNTYMYLLTLSVQLWDGRTGIANNTFRFVMVTIFFLKESPSLQFMERSLAMYY